LSVVNNLPLCQPESGLGVTSGLIPLISFSNRSTILLNNGINKLLKNMRRTVPYFVINSAIKCQIVTNYLDAPANQTSPFDGTIDITFEINYDFTVE
jgi:hypothetical protein